MTGSADEADVTVFSDILWDNCESLHRVGVFTFVVSEQEDLVTEVGKEPLIEPEGSVVKGEL